MKTILALAFLVVLVQAVPFRPRIRPSNENERALKPQLAEYINSIKTTWKASTEQGGLISKATVKEVRKLLGTRLDGPKLPKRAPLKTVDLPDNFDSRDNWPNCASIKQVRDQSACGSCWAFGAAEAISDRTCIFNRVNITLSVNDLVACCDSCGDGCDGGYPGSAWDYWVETGLTTESCDPYPFPSCDHHITNSSNPCPANEYPTPDCVQTCKDGSSWNTRYYGKSSYSVDESDIQAEIYQSGPVEAAYSVYEDFLTYKSGVYKHHKGSYLGGHAVRILGWGVENGTPYWLVANSWNVHWGDQGLFKILRGSDECGIESGIVAGLPKSL
eukprot:TRINITY_DN1343_c0_g1_i1.p1 TRINITY_DN1343_c0_g1~~TRINITY_DN1343_c0_g1_i1.p1  ORF type:complete len:330 (-),score=88.70 TRINITY_DN1343_c0_g1_i1:96-1085(-)